MGYGNEYFNISRPNIKTQIYLNQKKIKNTVILQIVMVPLMLLVSLFKRLSRVLFPSFQGQPEIL